ncbi:MAG: hypothetical protein HFF50_00410 [Lawsonibacter sp.]|nr:hypothetical protein [Lawsonibacter sp.]
MRLYLPVFFSTPGWDRHSFYHTPQGRKNVSKQGFRPSGALFRTARQKAAAPRFFGKKYFGDRKRQNRPKACPIMGQKNSPGKPIPEKEGQVCL